MPDDRSTDHDDTVRVLRVLRLLVGICVSLLTAAKLLGML
jgi:hypothetical protein